MNLRALVLAFLLLLALGALSVRLLRQPHGWEKKAMVEGGTALPQLAAVPNTVPGWPPEMGKVFPGVALYDHRGEAFSFQQLKGKPVLVEFIAMTCAACQAWSGAHERGVFDDLAAQQDLRGIETYFRQYSGGVELMDGPVNFVQLVIYDTKLKPPSSAILGAWREHFGFDKRRNVHVVSGGAPLCNYESFMRIPGFMLLDRNLIVRFDALGHTPRHHIYRELLPAVQKLLAEGPA